MDQGLFANLAAFVAISPSLGLLSERLQLKRVVPVAVDRAICEVRAERFPSVPVPAVVL